MEMTPAQKAEFDAKKAAPRQMTPAQRAEFDQKSAGGPSTGEQLTDVGRRMGSRNRGAAEFTMDVMRLPQTMWQRAKNATKGREEGEGFLGSLGGMMSGYFGETDMDRRGNEAMFRSESQPDLYEEEIGKGEGDAWLDPLKTGAGIATELATSAWMGGAKAAPTVLKSAPTSVGLGVAGQEMGGDLGEAAGIITGAITGDPVATTKLVAKILNPGTYIKGAQKGLETVFGRGPSLADASPRQINNALNAYVRQAFPDLPASELDEYVRQLAPRVKAAVAEGKQGSVGQLTDDAGLINFEKDMTNINVDATRREDVAALDKINAGISDEANAPMAAIEGITEKAGDIPAGLVNTRKLQAESAQSALPAATADLVSGNTKTQASTALKITMAKKAKESKGRMADAWSELPGGGVGPEELKRSVNKFYAGLGENSTKRFKQSFPKTSGAIDNIRTEVVEDGPPLENVTVDDISEIISIFSSERQAIRSGTTTGVGLKPERVDGFQDALFSALEGGTEGPIREIRENAAAVSRDYFRDYGPSSRLGRSLDSTDTKDFAESYLSGGDAGVVRRDELNALGGEDAAGQMDDYLKADFAASKVDDAGNYTKSGVDSFERKYSEQLSPELKGKVDILRDTTVKRDAAKEASKNLESSVVGKFAAGAGDAEEIVKRANNIMKVGGKNRSTELRTLMDSVGDNPEARNNIRRTFMDDFVNSVSKDGELTQKSYETFKKRRKVFQDSGAFTKEELDNIESGLQEGQKMFLHQDAKRLASIPAEKRRVLEVVSAVGGAKVGAMAFGSPLIGAALGKKAGRDALSQLTNVQARNLAFELATNPAKFVEQIDILKRGDLTVDEFGKVLKEMAKKAGTATTDFAERRIESLPGKIPAGAAAERKVE